MYALKVAQPFGRVAIRQIRVRSVEYEITDKRGGWFPGHNPERNRTQRRLKIGSSNSGVRKLLK